MMLVEHRTDSCGDGRETPLDGGIRCRPHDADVHESRRAVRGDVHDTDTAPGQAGIDTQDADGTDTLA
jgi:hypothetical protein